MSKRRVKVADLVTRLATTEDEPYVTGFCCSQGEWYEAEVEEFLNQKAIDQVSGGGIGYRLLLVLKGDDLVACGGHHLEPVLIDDGGEKGKIVQLVRLHVLAVGLEFQGRRLDDGTAISDAVLRLTASDALEAHGERALTGIVARDNHRSMAVLERNGRWSQVRYGADYVRFVGAMKAA